MAPRKRTTKQRKNNPKTAKLEAFLEEFDREGDYYYYFLTHHRNATEILPVLFSVVHFRIRHRRTFSSSSLYP